MLKSVKTQFFSRQRKRVIPTLSEQSLSSSELEGPSGCDGQVHSDPRLNWAVKNRKGILWSELSHSCVGRLTFIDETVCRGRCALVLEPGLSRASKAAAYAAQSLLMCDLSLAQVLYSGTNSDVVRPHCAPPRPPLLLF